MDASCGCGDDGPIIVLFRVFRFAEWRSNEAVVVEANPDYWDGAPELQAVVFRPITDANTRLPYWYLIITRGRGRRLIITMGSRLVPEYNKG